MKTGFWRRLSRDHRLLAIFALIAAALLAFMKVASEVMEGESRALDSAILTSVRSATNGTGPVESWFRSFMLDVTALGDTNLLILFSAIAVGYLLLERRRLLAAALAIGLTAGAFLEIGLKHFFDRARPELVTHLVNVTSLSFPSGHAMDSAMVYLTIATLLVRPARSSAVRVYVVGVAVALTVTIGISRIYLGVHWPTDVLAGWIMGAIWAGVTSLAIAPLVGGRGR